jgi:hypothetical protein
MKIHWHTCRERRFSFGERSPDPDWFEPIGFPPPWPWPSSMHTLVPLPQERAQTYVTSVTSSIGCFNILADPHG